MRTVISDKRMCVYKSHKCKQLIECFFWSTELTILYGTIVKCLRTKNHFLTKRSKSFSITSRDVNYGRKNPFLIENNDRSSWSMSFKLSMVLTSEKMVSDSRRRRPMVWWTERQWHSLHFSLATPQWEKLNTSKQFCRQGKSCKKGTQNDHENKLWNPEYIIIDRVGRKW